MAMFDCAHCGDRHHVNDFCATGPMSAEPVAPTNRETADLSKNPAETNTSAEHVKTADHAELARLAEAATHKSWAAFTDDSGGRPHTNLVSFEPITDCALSISGAHKNDPNVAFIAAANPATVLALLSEIAALRARLEVEAASHVSAKRQLVVEFSRATQAERQRDEARDTIASTVAKADWMQGHLSGERSSIDRETIELVVSECRAYCHLQALANQGADQ